MNEPSRESPKNHPRELVEEEFGLDRGSFLDEKIEPELLPYVGRELRERIRNQFVTAEHVKSLHPEISSPTADSTAHQLSIAILRDRIARELKITVGLSDIQQVVAGTFVASRQTLSQVSFALGASSQKIIEAAQQRQWSGENPRDDLL
ncbi:MAG: hypothetical protein ACO3XO_06580 [Bdellovibrionota bacterium]|jgi:hypothetical protein